MSDAPQFGLIKDARESADIIRKFDAAVVAETAKEINEAGRLLFTGEGSSRLFPAKSAIAKSRQENWPLVLHTEAGRQASEYSLHDWAVVGLSNSGRTREVIRLFQTLAANDHRKLFSITAAAESTLESLASRGHVLNCGKENAVAATKSVIEQALYCWAIVAEAAGQRSAFQDQLPQVAEAFEAALNLEIDEAIIDKFASARMIFWAGRNDGVGEELTLKTNEITRKDADFLEGTYAVHGVEEVMSADDIIVWVDPYDESIETFQKVLVDGVGATLVAISSRELSIPTIHIQNAGDLSPFVQMAAGWNLLIRAGLKLGVDIDKPQRARKVGNEYSE